MTYDPSQLRSYIDHHFTYIAGFERNRRRYGREPAIIDPGSGRRWTYAELGVEVDALAAALYAAGVRRGDRVVHQLFNTPEFAVFYLATQRLAAIGVPINFRLSAGETAHILNDSTPAVYAFDSEISGTASAALARAEVDPQTIVIDRTASATTQTVTTAQTAVTVGQGSASSAAQTVPGAIDYANFLDRGQGAPLPALPADFSTYEETTRLYTSGTTGMPKGVALPSIVEVMSAHDVMMHFPLGPADRTLNMTPWFHRGGLYSGGPNPVFYAGGSLVPMPMFDPARALDLVDEESITFLIGAPATLELIADEQERQPRRLETLKGIVTMGAPLDRDAALRYQRLLTPRIFNGYGTTETFWNTFLRPEDLPDQAGSAGRASTDDDVRVVKIHPDRRAEPDEVVARDGSESGEVIMRSPKSGFSYVNLPGAQEEKFHSGWFYPGDIATWDADEFVTVLGRKDDMIISGGENVHPVQVEESLARHPGVRDSAVVGIPDRKWGQKVVAYVVAVQAGPGSAAVQAASGSAADGPNTGEAAPTATTPTATELDAFLLADEDLADFKRPRGYVFVDSLPVTATGKKIHYEVARRAAEDAETGAIQFLGFRTEEA